MNEPYVGRPFSVEAILRPHIKTLKPYSSAREEYSGKIGLFLDANENALGSPVKGNYARYPDPLQRELKKAIAELKGVQPEQIFLGNGSDEAIDLLFRAFCEPQKDQVLLLPPTYGMYQVSADINTIDTVSAPLTADFHIDVDKVLMALHPDIKLVFICSPNNPSGNLMDIKAIEEILTYAPGLVVVDEAYIDFANQPSLLSHLFQDYPQLVILQTFSKAWGLANLRLGMAFAHPEIIEVFNRIKPPYNVNGYTQQTALSTLQQKEKKQEMVREILASRDALAQSLTHIPFVKQVYPSDANFLLVKMDQAEQVYHDLIASHIIVRNRTKVLLCDDCLRITVGTQSENDQLIHSLQRLATNITM